MAKIITYLQLVLTLTILCDGFPQIREAPEEYLGCYNDNDNTNSRLFTSSPGEYLPDHTSPVACILACSKSWPYAGIENGKFCLCSSEKPVIFVDEVECSSKCPDNSTNTESKGRCGGVNRISVYDASKRISDLHLDDISPTEVYKNVELKADISNGDGAEYIFQAGDGSTLKPDIPTTPEVSYVYSTPGFYEVSVEAFNNISGHHTAKERVRIIDTKFNGILTCPYSQVYGQDVECTGMVTRGSPLMVSFDYGDGAMDQIKANVKYGTLGVYDVTTASSNTRDATFTMIIPMQNFEEDSVVYAWQVDVFKAGTIYLQIFRPKCNADEHFCPHEHACLQTPCDPYEQRICGENQIFCALTEKCVTQTGNTACAISDEYNFRSIPADYELIWQQKHEVEKTGRHLFEMTSQIQVNKGDVIGWTSDGGELSYGELTANDAPEFYYNAATTVGGMLIRPNGVLRHWKHVIQAYYINPSSFYLRHRYATPGAYLVTSNLTNNAMVFIDVPVDSIKINCPVYKLTNEEFHVTLDEHQGTNITYRIDYGNSENSENNEASFSKAYTQPGVYEIKLDAINSVSSKTDSCMVKIYDDISNLHFEDDVQPVAIGTPTTIRWCVEKGTNVSYSVEFGDSEIEQVIDFTKNCYEIQHIYENNGIYDISIKATNDIESREEIKTKAIVDEPISSLKAFTTHAHLTKFVYLGISEAIDVQVLYEQGTRITCRYDFGENDGDAVVDTRTIISYQYKEEGTYNVRVSCYNSISNLTALLNATLVVQQIQEISGLTIHSTRTAFGEDAVISVSMTTGSLFLCNWNLGDGTQLSVDPSLFSDIIHHNYAKVGDYEVTISCQNKLGEDKTSYTLAVEVPIDGFAISCPPEYASVGEELTFTLARGTGSRLSFRVDFGDGKDLLFSGDETSDVSSLNANHIYLSAGDYSVHVYAWNQLGNTNQSCSHPIRVQHPVKDLIITSDSDVKLDPGIATFKLRFEQVTLFPTNALLDWNFGDGGIESNVPLVKPTDADVLRTYKYTSVGVYKVELRIHNEVSEETYQFTINVQQMIPLQMSIQQRYPQSVIPHPGYGEGKGIFALERIIVVEITEQHLDKEYQIDFNTGSGPISSNNSVIEYKYQQPGFYQIQATTINELANLTAFHNITVQESLNHVKFNATPVVELGELTEVIIEAWSFGSDSCIMVDMGDSIVYTLNEQFCDHNRNSSLNYTALQNEIFSPIKFKHEYTETGNYDVNVLVYNHVSSYENLYEVEVEFIPCPMFPEVSISGGGNKSYAVENLRSNGIVLQSNVSVFCPKADSVVFFWKIYEGDSNVPIVLVNNHGFRKSKMPFQRKPGSMDPTVFELAGNILPYGLMRIELNIYYESETTEAVSEFTAHDSTWFKIVPSKLEANIEGGIRRAVGHQLDVPFDARRSFDPDRVDVINEAMTYQWYCRRHEEEFPEHFELVNPTDPTAGCFRSGSFFLQEGVGGFEQLTADGSKISIKTNLSREIKYTMRVFVQKGPRQGIYDQEFVILSGAPPSMELYCTYNCYKKLNPTEPLKIQSVCNNCNSTMTVHYHWQLFKVLDELDELGDFKEEEIAELDSKTTTSIENANIAIRENVLEQGIRYKLKVTAWKTGGNKGFSDFVFTVNEPPSSGFCGISPRNGETLNTTFTAQCGDWVDQDTPLLYIIDIVKGGVRQNLYTGYERVISTVLPMGEKDDHFEYDVVISVQDSLQFGVSEIYSVKVTEPKNVDYNQVSNNMDDLAKSGDIQLMAQTAYAAGTLMNKNSDTNMQETRSKMLKAVSSMRPCKLTEIKQMGGVQSEMTKATGELSDEAQEESGSALDAMSDCMMNATESDKNMGEAAQTVFSASTNILSAGSAKNVSNSTGKSNTDKTLDTINKVGGSLMRQMVAGDKPTKLKAGNLDIQMSQVADNADEDETGFKIPDIGYILGNQSSIEVTGRKASVGAMVTSSSDNPYKGANGGDDVKSDVMGLALTGPDGRPMNLVGQYMTMFVKRDVTKDKPLTPYEYDVASGAMKVHRFNFTNNNTYMAIEIRPIDERINISVYISYEKRPTVSNAVTNYTLINLEKARNLKKLPDPFIRVFTTAELNGTGEYYLGIKMSPSKDEIFSKYGEYPTMEYTLRTWETVCKIWDDDEKAFTTDGCKVGPKTTFNKTECICRLGGEMSEAPISTTQSTTPYMTTTQWRREMQAPVRQKKVTRATFAGGFFVMPNPIDFSKAFAGFANLADNPVTFATVLSIFGVFLILLFWARREDRKDVERAGVTALKDNDSFDRQFYEITVYTGFTSNAATTSNVYFQLSGDEGQSEVRQLKDGNRKIFQKRGQDIFLASFPDHVGDLNYLRIWHDNSGKNPSWYLSRVMVHDLNEDRKYLFINDNLMAVEEGDGSLERLLPVAGPDEIKSFNHLFFSTTQKNITDNHIWFSVFIRPPKSRFTRVQRLSCCLTLLYCTMVTSAMFYQVGGESDPSTTLHIGPFAFAPAQIGIGIMTSLIIFPINILIVGVFRSIGPKPTADEMKKKKTQKRWWIYELFFCCPKAKRNEFIDILSSNEKANNPFSKEKKLDDLADVNTLDGSTIGLKMETPAQEQQREDRQKKQKKKKKKLPYWMKYFAWTLLILTSFTSAFFVVLYGFQFGKEKSAQWLSALFISFVQDVCISQPIKILGLALFVALVVKKPADEEEEEEGDANKKQIDEEYLNNENSGQKRRHPRPDNKEIIRFQPPSKEKVAALRTYRLKELKMYNLLRDIFVYLMFVIALCQVSYSHLDPRSYNVRKSMEYIFVDGDYSENPTPFTSIGNANDVWSWLETSVVDGLYANTWYNEAPNKPGFVGDLYSNLFGGSRLRQLRVKDDSCTIHKDFENIVTGCHGWYSWGEEEIGQFDPEWKPVTNYTLHNPSKYYKSWEYQTSDELDTYPFVGSVSTYRGGGYVGDMGKSPKVSKDLISHLKENRWLDAQTRAVFLEVTVYNAQVNLFAIMNFVVEFTPTNGVELFQGIKIARLYTFGGSTASFTIACQFFVLLFFLITIYREGKKIYREKKAYFKGFWNLMEFSIIIIVIATVGVFFSRMLLVDAAVKRIEENPGQFVSFNKVTQWDVLFSALSSILVLLSCIKSIRLLQYNKTICLLAATLKGCAKPLLAFSVVFLVFFIAFTTFAYIMFVSTLSDYKNFITASESVMSLLLGGFEFSEIKEAKPTLGRIWFILIMLFGVMYIMNVFLSIIMETYATVKEDLTMQSQEYELVDFMVKKFMKIIGKGDGGMKEALAHLDENKPKEKKVEKKKSLAKRIPLPNRKKYFKLLDEEIELKFQQLDNSLNGIWLDHADEKPFDKKSTRSYVNPGYEFEEVHNDLLMEQDLRNELAKWS